MFFCDKNVSSYIFKLTTVVESMNQNFPLSKRRGEQKEGRLVTLQNQREIFQI